MGAEKMNTPIIADYLNQSVETLEAVKRATPVLSDMSAHLVEAIRKGGTVLLCGNGGSYAMAQHFASELSVRFERDRPGFHAQTLGADGVTLTALSNDYCFGDVFARSLSVVAKAGDVLIAMSTSGTSVNVVRVLERAREMGVSRLGFTGDHDTGFEGLCDLTFVASSKRTAFVQEAHLIGLHAICARLDAEFTLDPAKG